MSINNSYQFIHIECYSINAAKKTRDNKKKRTVQEIINEVVREENYFSDLITEPHSFEDLEYWGEDPRNLVSMCQDVLDNPENKDPLGRKLRKDTTLLLAGVASYKCIENQTCQQTASSKHYKKWRAETIKFLRQEYGENLKTVVEHTDEAHPHLHFYVINPDGPATKLHDGWAAVENEKSSWISIKDKTEQKREKNRIYNTAMSNFQNKYNKFMLPIGMLRIGPKRQRLTRSSYMLQKKQAAQIYLENEKLKQNKKSLADYESELKQKYSIVENLSESNFFARTISASVLAFKKSTSKDVYDDLNKAIEKQNRDIEKLSSELKHVKSELVKTEVAKERQRRELVKQNEELQKMLNSVALAKSEQNFQKKLKN